MTDSWSDVAFADSLWRPSTYRGGPKRGKPCLRLDIPGRKSRVKPLNEGAMPPSIPREEEKAATPGTTPSDGGLRGAPPPQINPNGAPALPRRLLTVPPGPAARQKCEEILGLDLRSPLAQARLAALAGAGDGHRAQFGVRDNDLTITVEGAGFESKCAVQETENGAVLQIDLMKNSPTSPRRGLEVFVNQLKVARGLGIQKVFLHAASQGKRGPMNGYYTWPRFGFDANLDEYQVAALSVPFRIRAARRGGGLTLDDVIDNDVGGRVDKVLPSRFSLRDLFDMPGGAEEWKKNGSGIYCHFDLAQGSRSMLALEAYLREKGHANFTSEDVPHLDILKVLVAHVRHRHELAGNR
jgi:rRNA maturation protein Nop10